MPIYEYRCRECGHELEKLQKLSDPPLELCPSCGQSTLAKLVSAAGFRLAGGGWYETDFKQDKKRNLAGESGGGSGGEQAAKADKKENKKVAASETARPTGDAS